MDRDTVVQNLGKISFAFYIIAFILLLFVGPGLLVLGKKDKKYKGMSTGAFIAGGVILGIGLAGVGIAKNL